MIWHYAREGQSYGPVSADDLQALIRSGRVTRDTLVWRSGLADWIAVGASEMGAVFDDGPPALPAGGSNGRAPADQAAMAGLPDVKPLSGLARMVRWAVFAYLAVSVVNLIVMVFWVEPIIEIGPALLRIDPLDFLTAEDEPRHWANALQIYTFLAAGIPILNWKRRACENLHRVQARGVDISPGWAVWSYYIPVVNLWLPFQAMSQIARASLNPHNPEAVTKAGPLGWWWCLWLATLMLPFIASGLIREAAASTSLELFDKGVSLLAIHLVLLIPLSLTLLSIVRIVTEAQDHGRILQPGALQDREFAGDRGRRPEMR